jgi:hypothetical protein
LSDLQRCAHPDGHSESLNDLVGRWTNDVKTCALFVNGDKATANTASALNYLRLAAACQQERASAHIELCVLWD